MKLFTLLASGTLASAAFTGSAFAAQDETKSITVHYGDLNLAAPSGLNVLKRRVQHAAEIVCGDPDSRELKILAGYRTCVENATSSALAQVELPHG